MFFFYPIHPAGGLALALESVFGTAQRLADLDERAFVLLIASLESLFQAGGNLLQREPLAVLRIFSRIPVRLLEERHQHLAQSVHLLEAQVVLHQGLLLFLRQIVAFTQLLHLVFQLGIELVVLHGCLEVDAAFHLHTDETPRPRGIHERHRIVGSANERGIAAMTGICLAVGRAVLEVGGGNEVLQHDLLTLRYLVELVEIDERERGQSQVQVALVLEVDAVIVVFALIPRQQDTAETRLAAALTAY